MSPVRGAGSAIEVTVVDGEDRPVSGQRVRFVGNYNSPERQQVQDRITRVTDEAGRVRLTFPRYSVLTSIWHVAAAGPQPTDYRRVTLREGRTADVVIGVQ
ncbi:MAG TPA: hypothetical protein VKA64_04215 [Gammaproteobacteria bacterium]|nr:hypothetical protein [Gammaproteobacteria bacterium]